MGSETACSFRPRIGSPSAAISEHKVIPFRNRDQPETWEAALNEAASDGWTLVSTGARGDMLVPVPVLWVWIP